MSIRSITNAKNTKVGIRNKSQHPTRTILQRISWIYPEDGGKDGLYIMSDKYRLDRNDQISEYNFSKMRAERYELLNKILPTQY